MSVDYVTVQSSGAEGYSNLKTWLRDVAPFTPGVQRSMLKRQLLLACREFFEQSYAWRATMGPITIVDGQPNYQLSPFNSYTDIVGVMSMSWNGLLLQPLVRLPPSIPTQQVTGQTPVGFFMLRPDIIALFKTPTAPFSQTPVVLAYVALTPKTTVEQVPKIAQTHFYEPILCGLLYRLLSQPAKPYSNPALAATFEAKFRSYIGQYAARAKQGFNGGQAWAFPRFGK